MPEPTQRHEPVRAARRTDQRTGIVEEAGFLDSAGGGIFSVVHLPPVDPVAGLLVCSPIFAEFEKNYRREVPLARSLAARGIAVQRFHYRGTGHSDDAETTFDTMLEDALLAADALVERTGVPRLGLMGTRFGSLVAAGAATRFPGAPLALWDPVVEPVSYFREAFRYRILANIKQRQDGPQSADDLLDQLRRTGSEEVVGYPLRLPLYESVEGHTLHGELGTDGRPVLLVQFGQPQRPLRAEYRNLRDRLQRDGSEVDTAVASLDEVWLFATHWQPPERLLTVTRDWIERQLAGTLAPS